MERIIIKCVSFFLILSGASMEAAENDWKSLHLPLEHIETMFPRTPIHMTFDVPLKDTESLAKLNVYTTQHENCLLMLNTIHSPLFDGKEMETANFVKHFDAFIIQRLFFQPQIFKNHKTLKLEKTTFLDRPAIDFSFSYLDNGIEQHLAGIAISKDHKLYVLMSICPANEFDEDVLNKFEEDFKFLSSEK